MMHELGRHFFRYHQNRSLNPSFTSPACCTSPWCRGPADPYRVHVHTHPGFTYLFGLRKYDCSENLRRWSASWFPALIRRSNWGITQPCKCFMRVLCTLILLRFLISSISITVQNTWKLQYNSAAIIQTGVWWRCMQNASVWRVHLLFSNFLECTLPYRLVFAHMSNKFSLSPFLWFVVHELSFLLINCGLLWSRKG